MLEQRDKNGLTFYTLENDYVRTEWVPEIGAKMISCIDKETGYQFLPESHTEYSLSRVPYYGAKYEKYYPGGLDDCFPTIQASKYQVKSNNLERDQIRFPEHGEIWSLPWDVYTSGSVLILKIKGVRLQYEITKKIQLLEKTIHIEYILTNHEDTTFNYIWSAYSMFRISSDNKLLLEPDMSDLWINLTVNEQFENDREKMSIFTHNSETPIKYILISPDNIICPSQLYSNKLSTGFCGVYYPEINAALVFSFNPEIIPYVGIEITCPESNRPGSLNQKVYDVSFQPSNGRNGKLQEAAARGECGQIGSREVQEWDLDISILNNIKMPTS